MRTLEQPIRRLPSKSDSRSCPSPATKRRRIPVVAIDYRTAHGDGSSKLRPRLLGLTCQVPGCDPQHLAAGTDLAAALRTCGDRRRIYANGLQARLMEEQQHLPQADRFEDVLIMARLLDEDWPRDLSKLAATLLGDSRQTGKRQPVEAILALCSKARLRERIHDEGLDAVYKLELDVIDPTVAMMHNGILVNTGRLTKMIAEFDPLATTSQGKSARHYAGLRDTAQQLLRFVDPSTSRIHCRLDPLGTKTGRFRCTDPAMQSVPLELKKAFIAPPGHVLLEADFSQIELRVLAHFSQEPAFLQAFSGGDGEIDLHRRTAAMALGIDESDVTLEQRNTIGKGINFGISTA